MGTKRPAVNVATLTDDQLIRYARKLVERALVHLERYPFIGAQLIAVRRTLGEIGGDYRPDDPFAD